MVPWALTATSYQTKVLFRFNRPSPELISQDIINPLFTFNTIVLYSAYFFYWILKRRATKILHGLELESIFRIVEYPIMFPINMFLITIPAYIIAGFGALFEGR